MCEWEKKVVELEQAIDEREHALYQGGSDLQERSKWVEELEEEMERCFTQLGGLNASTSALGSNSWSMTLLPSVTPCVLGDTTPLFLLCSGPPSSPNPNSSTTNPTPYSIPPQGRPRRDWDARRDLYLSAGERGCHLLLVCTGVCAVEGACEEVECGWGLEVVDEEEQEAVLMLSLLLEWSILGLAERFLFPTFSRF